MKNQKVRNITYIALMVAFLAVVSQISIPTAFSVPITLQAFAVSLVGYIFTRKRATLVVLIYMLIGAIGIPVFANFQGGLFHLFNYTGGFIWGFIPLVLLCSTKVKAMEIPFGIIGVVMCHVFGVIQYSLVGGISPLSAFLTMSLPYIFKDFILIVLAYLCSRAINSRIKTK